MKLKCKKIYIDEFESFSDDELKMLEVIISQISAVCKIVSIGTITQGGFAMNEDTRKNIPSGQEIQNNELNEEQLDEVTGGLTIRMLGAGGSRQCAAAAVQRLRGL